LPLPCKILAPCGVKSFGYRKPLIRLRGWVELRRDSEKLESLLLTFFLSILAVSRGF